MGSYRTLKAWQLSRVLTSDVYKITLAFPKSETYGLGQQMRRAASSIMCNIAEGQGRWTRRDRSNFYWIARGSLHEVESQLFIAADVGYITNETLEKELRLTEQIASKLNGLIHSTLEPQNRGPRTEDRGPER